MQAFKPRTDAITFEVVRHRLWQINDEQGTTILNVSGSPVATEGNDFNVALMDADGELISVGPFLLIHVSAITAIVRNAIAFFGEDGITDGDMYLTNDPWLGAAHQNDVAVIQPVFWQGKRVAWTGSVIHQVDVGGPYPGSWNPKAYSAFDEAPRYHFLTVVRQGNLQPNVVATYLGNSRLPRLVELDLRAQIAAANVARERLYQLYKRYGSDTVAAVIADCLDYAQFLFGRKLREIPDGTWYAEDHLDHDGHREQTYTVRCKLTKTGDQLTFDFRESDAQADGFINCTESGAYAGVYAALFPYMCDSIPWNSGVLRHVSVLLRGAAINNAKFPAPVSFGNVHATQSTMNASALVLGKLLSCSPRYAREAMANWSGSAYVYNIFGQFDYGRSFATMLLSSDLQGCGAFADRDGFDVGGKLGTPRPKTASIESIEANYPLLYLYSRRAIDSGGAGRWRGGVAAEIAFMVHRGSPIDMTINTVGVAYSSTSGLCGGYPGGGSTVEIVHDVEIRDIIARRGKLDDRGTWNGRPEYLPSKAMITLQRTDVFIAVAHGGGGFGDPLDRPILLVANDVAEGLVSSVWAERLYGVVLNEHGAVDELMTNRIRNILRSQRTQWAHETSFKPELISDGAQAAPFGALRLKNSIVFCPRCLTKIGLVKEGFKRNLACTTTEVGDDGPWIARRWNGRSPDFRSWKYACPSCGTMLAVELHRCSDQSTWDDHLITDQSNAKAATFKTVVAS